MHLEDARAVSVAAGDREFGYWHVVPAVRHLERVSQHQLLGHVEAPWLHVHFAERSADVYRNPLRRDALTPWTDTTRPSLTAIGFMRNGNAVPADLVAGAVDVVAEARDVPPVPVPAPWHGLPVTPAKLRWRVHRGGTIVRRWHTPIDFTKGLLPQSRFDKVYAPGTRQNHAGKPGRYRFFLAHTWSTQLLPDGAYELEVQALDLAGNTGSLRLPFTLANEL